MHAREAMSNAIRSKRVMTAQAAGSTVLNSTGVYTADGEKVRFKIHFGTITVAPTIKVQRCDTLGGTYADITDAVYEEHDLDDDDKMGIVELVNTAGPYMRLVIDRTGGNSEINSVEAEVAGMDVVPVTQDDTVITPKIHIGLA